MIAVAYHQTAAPVVPLISQLSYVGVDFGFQGGGEHAPRAFADDFVDQGTVRGAAVGIDYAEHGRAFPTRAANAGLLGDHHRINREGTPLTSNPRLIHRS